MTGLIPAHAGKTTDSGEGVRAQGAHPRSRGENFCRLRPGPIVLGSSPLTRGKPCPGLADGRAAGLIPAHAGKTPGQLGTGIVGAAHPRSRGENYQGFQLEGGRQGSSPLTRGKLLQRERQQGRHGLIPAHAGKTLRQPCMLASPRAHPRSRGENVIRSCMRRSWLGSSPLTRGKHAPDTPAGDRAGLIPAHAGKTECRRV